MDEINPQSNNVVRLLPGETIAECLVRYGLIKPQGAGAEGEVITIPKGVHIISSGGVRQTKILEHEPTTPSSPQNTMNFQQVTLEQAQGKSFDRLLISTGEDQILILFKDRTFAVLGVKHWDHECGDISEQLDPVSKQSIKDNYTEYELIEVGFVTKEEIAQGKAERQREWAESCRATDIATLRRLQALYPEVR